jgi:peroxiredoxin
MAGKTKPIWRIDVGDEAPDFDLIATGDHAGKGGPTKRISLASFRGRKNVLIAFYPAAFTPV